MGKNVKTEQEKTEFFCYSGKQYITGKILYSIGREKLNPATGKLENDELTAKYIEFDNGCYSTSDEFEIEFLDKYNSGGELSDGRILKPTPFPTISRNSLESFGTKVVEKVIETVVEKKVIPSVVIEFLDEAAIADLAKNEFAFELKSDEKKDMIKELKEAGFVS